MNLYLAVLKKSAEFGGRIKRKEYWIYLLFNMILDNFPGIAMVGGHRQ
jgi:uncharacterized membrane protein YhaH (DUF805 family)